MFEKFLRKSCEWMGSDLIIETGKLARNSLSSVLIKYRGVTILTTVCAAVDEGADNTFFPLSVHFISKSYSVGKVPGGYFKREGKPSERDVLTSRLIDRSVRPLFDKNFMFPVVIISQLLTYDGDTDYDALAVISASAALSLSGLPLKDLIASIRLFDVGKENYIYNHSQNSDKVSSSALDLLISATESSILMIESSGSQYPENKMISAIKDAHENILPVISLIKELSGDYGDIPVFDSTKWANRDELLLQIKNILDDSHEDKVSEIYNNHDLKPSQRSEALKKLYKDIYIKNADSYEESKIKEVLSLIEADIVRKMILQNKRVDGRACTQIRQIETEVETLGKPVHGSGLFTRGETQSLSSVTLGNSDDELALDDISSGKKENFMLHYNFWPFSVGEAGSIRAVSRRETGHGRLAHKAILPLLPDKDTFPYTIRVVSEILESNGSSSMATVCASSMALMDAGVPMIEPVAGIAMGLIMEGDTYAILSDIAGIEDHMGDIDFKVAGTKNGITALQMDVKICGINKVVLANALKQARDGRLHILSIMNETISSASKPKEHSPRVAKITIDKDKIRDLIGTGGKVIKRLSEQYSVKIDVTQEGLVTVMATSLADLEKAEKEIKEVTAVLTPGIVVTCSVNRQVNGGYIVAFSGSNKGFIPEDWMPEDHDSTEENNTFFAVIVNVESQMNRIKLSAKAVDQKSGSINDDEFKEHIASLDKSKFNDKRFRKGNNRNSSPKYKNKDSHNKNYVLKEKKDIDDDQFDGGFF